MNSLALLKCAAKNHLIKHSSVFETIMGKNIQLPGFVSKKAPLWKSTVELSEKWSWQLPPFTLLNSFMCFNLFKIYFASLGRDFAKNQVDGNVCKAFSHWIYVMMVEQSLGKWERLFNKMYEGSIIKMCFCLANPFFVSIVTVLRLVCKFNYSLIQFMCFYPSSDFFISPFLCFFFILGFYFYLRLIFAYIRQDLCVCACVSLLFWSFHLKLTSNT